MNAYKFIMACMFLLTIADFSSAQDGSVKVKVFDGTTTPQSDANKYDAKNYLYINPYLLPRGILSLGYERVLHEKHSILAELGITYRDYIYETANDIDAGFFGDNSSKVRVGKYLQVGYKFYPTGIDDFDGGFYISPSFMLRNYNLTDNIEFYNGKTYVPAMVDMSYSMNELALKFGFCRESWLLNDLISDLYFGVGSRTITSHGYTTTSNFVLVPTTQIVHKPALYLGVKFGIVL